MSNIVDAWDGVCLYTLHASFRTLVTNPNKKNKLTEQRLKSVNWMHADGSSFPVDFKLQFPSEPAFTMYCIKKLMITMLASTPLNEEGFADGAMLRNGIIPWSRTSHSAHLNPWFFEANPGIDFTAGNEVKDWTDFSPTIRKNMDFFRAGFELTTPFMAGSSGFSLTNFLATVTRCDVKGLFPIELTPPKLNTFTLDFTKLSQDAQIKSAIFYPEDAVGFTIRDNLPERGVKATAAEAMDKMSKKKRVKKAIIEFSGISHCCSYISATMLIAYKFLSAFNLKKSDDNWKNIEIPLYKT